LKRFRYILHFLILFLTAGSGSAMAQNYFRVIDGVPHIPLLDPASVVSPQAGMLIYSISDNEPVMYTGTEWSGLCSADISAVTSQEYFIVKNGIPCIPALSTEPAGPLKPGTIYYSTLNKAVMVYNGSSWTSVAEMATGSFTGSAGFASGLDIRTCKLPVLHADPSSSAFTAGAIYINAALKVIRFYNGSAWNDISCKAIVRTLAVTDIGGYSAKSGGEVSTNGGSPVTLMGICWSLDSDPDISLSTKTGITGTGTGIGVFAGEMTALLPNTSYHVRAYAVNTQGIVYGEDLVFKTPVAPPVIITLEVKEITSTSAGGGGDISADGGAPVTKRGIIWSVKGDPLNDPDQVITDDGSGVGPFPSTMEGLLGNTTYYVRAYAVNAAGKSYGNLIEFTTPVPVPPLLNAAVLITHITGSSAAGTALILNNGGALVTERGLCYSTDRLNYTCVPSSTVTPADIGTFVTDLSGLAQGTTYYVKAYAVNSAGTGYSNETSFITASYASVITKKPGGISGTTAISGGEITNSGYSEITGRGICWDTEKDPAVDLATKTSDPVTGDGTGSYNSKLTGLIPGTTYYVRAYAINTAGVAYGNLDSLIVPDYPKVLTAAASFYQSTTITGGNIISDGGSAVTERGVCWGTALNPAVTGSHTSDGEGLGWFTSLIPALNPNVTYHIRAYARNSVGVAYGEDLTFMINPDAPVIITLDISDITSMSALSGGNIVSRGSAVITLRGVVFSTLGDPLTDPLATVVTNDGSGEGYFPSKMEGLLGNTTYYVRAYAANVYGKSYGELKSFTTSPPVLPLVWPPSFDINDISNTAASGVFVVVNNGGDPVTERGIRYSTDRVNYTYVPSETLTGKDIGTFTAKLTGLSPNITYYAQAYAINAVGTGLSVETSFVTSSLAILNTIMPYDITGFNAYSGGDIISTGDDVISAKGVCWSTEKYPTADLVTRTSEPLSGIGTGVFNSYLTGLTSGTKYYIRAYAVNSFGIAYGNLDSLTTSTTAFITTSPATGITSTTARTGGYIQNDGNEYVSARGVCWSTFPNPGLSGSYISSGAGTGMFSVQLIELLGNTRYYIRAYAINSVGTSYGNLDSFKTAPPVIPLVKTVDVINIGGTSALGRGNITGNGGSPVSERGFCWSTSSNPDISGDHAASGGGSGSFSGNLTGLTPNTRYYLRAYAINEVGVSYGNEISFSTYTIATVITTAADNIISTGARSGGSIISDGGAQVTSSGICWSTNSNPDLNDPHTTSGTGIGTFIHNLSGLWGSTTYYIRAYALNSAGTAYGQAETFTTAPPIAPSLSTTSGRSGVNGTTAICGGTIISHGGAAITTEGLVYSTTSGFIPDTVTVNITVLSGSGNFSSTIRNLKPGTTYYARAYAINSVGIGYAANEVSFTTFNRPVITTITPDLSTLTSVGVKTGGNILSSGGTEITESGICWSTEGTPTTADAVISNGPGSGSFTRVITEQMGNTTYYVRAYAINSVGITYGQVESFTTLPPVLATILTTQPVATSSATANSGGTIVSHGGSMVTTRGICWSTDRNFNPDTVTNNRTAQTGYYTGAFAAVLSGLIPETVYYVRAYVVNGVGVAYGAEMSFKTPTLATLSTTFTVANGPTKATSGGTISYDGGAAVSSRGVVWSTDPNFDPALETGNRTTDGSGSGAFVSKLSELKGSTTYYIRAYARNIAGTGYGNLLSFITDPPTLATLTTRDAWNINGTTVSSGGYISDNGGEPVTTRGVVWSTTKGFRPDTVINNKIVQTGSGTGYFTSAVTGLKRGITYYMRAYGVNSVGIAYASNEISFTTLDQPYLTTMPVMASSTGYSASGGGVVISDGGAGITNQGVCWSTSPAPTTGLHTKTTYDGWSGNSFYSSITELSPVTKYYLRAYAVNNQGTSYGNEVVFTTPPALSSITTTYATAISKSSVMSGGQITNDGGAPVTERGLIWSTDQNFNPDTVVLNRNINGAGTGKFSSTIENMQLSISYYIRAYATNSAGTAYGNQVTVTIFPTSPILNTIQLTDITGTSVKSGGEIVSDGGAPITLKGICWSTHTNPTVDDSRTYNGTGDDNYAVTISGLKPNTLYYIRAYAINKIGTAYGVERTVQTNNIPTLTASTPVTNIIATTATSGGEITDDGRSPILSRGICWSTYSNPDISLSTRTIDNSSAGIGSFIANMKSLKPGTTYYVRAYATNAVGTGYGSQVQFTTLAVMLPTVVTVPPFDIDSVKAWSGGDVTDDGGMPVTSRGIIWSTLKTLDINTATKLTNSVSDTGRYINQFAGLSPGTKYYVKAFAINSKGTAYGNLDSLVTKAIRATLSNVVMSDLTQTTGKGTAAVITDGGGEITERGLCWNTTGNPVITDDTVRVGSGKGSFAGALKVLAEGPVYFVRAYAINNAGVAYSPLVTSFRICPSAFDVIHTEGFSGSPVSKTVTYHSVSSTASGKAVCWITQNLGADRQATSVADASEAAAGWYWQFNRPQGYQYASARNPLTAWTSLTQNSDWQPENDPCNLMLGSGWRMPTSKEYTNVIANGGIPFNTPLKLHYSGYLNYADGSLVANSRGVYGIFWSSSATTTTYGSYLQFSNGANNMYNSYKWHGFTLRCLRDTIVMSTPSVSKVTISNMTQTAVDASAVVTPDGGSPVTDRGFCWNTTGGPTVDDNKIESGTGLGVFSTKVNGLEEGPTYYIRAYATNSKGTVYSPEVTSFKICPPEFIVEHVEGLNGAPVSKTVTYHSVSSTYSGMARCWITQNLGADRQATAVAENAEAAAGWYWQFNRSQGYQYAAARTPSMAWTSLTQTSDWQPENDPCNLLLGSGWRIPTSVEYTNVIANGGILFTTPLKLHYSGYLNYADGSLAASSRGTYGIFWSSTATSSTYATYLQFSSGANANYNSYKWHGFTLRCLRDTIVLSKPSVSKVTFSGMTSTSVDVSAIVTPDGGSPVTARGFCWNVTGDPTVSDNKISSGEGLGNFNTTLKDLTEGPTYYVRAYATNSLGTVYSTEAGSFKICPPEFTIQHIEGIDGAALTKKVTYHSVSSTLSGKAACWLTQNLGADQQPASLADATDSSAGWYWQFNRLQSFRHDGTTRTPMMGWIALNETSNWIPGNDPCGLLLGSGWRLPSSSEWTTVIAGAGNSYTSPLKLHYSGYLVNTTGVVAGRGTQGNFWSSTANSTTAATDLPVYSTASPVLSHDKAYGFSVRCLRDSVVISKPSVDQVSMNASSMTATTGEASAAVASDGGSKVTGRGFCWNTTGSPTLADKVVADTDGGTGSFKATITELKEGDIYYIRAYATNSAGTSYSEGTGFNAVMTVICPPAFDIRHTAGVKGAPVSKTVTYHAVGSYMSGAAKCWITQNLGADQQALSATDATEPSAGWYFQFNRFLGYQHTGAARTPIAWMTAISEASDWTTVNDPCNNMLGADWRLPTYTEWLNVNGAPQNWNISADAYNSELKLHNAGYLAYNTGALGGRGTQGNYWSSTRNSNVMGWDLQFYNAGSALAGHDKAYGFSVRCLRNGNVKMPPTLSNVVISGTTMTDSTAEAIATILVTGGNPVTAKGIVWNTAGNPTIDDNKIASSSTDSTFNGIIEGLKEGLTYYVRAYAVNSIGMSYSPQVTQFKVCPPAFDVLHSAGFNGAPVTKTVTYHSVNSTLSGAARCWITQNLGADRVASSADDVTEASAGWYWQFNRIQGYKHDGSVLIPGSGWVASISESSDWTAANDPCNVLLSTGWRMPTSTEWTAAVVNGNWGSVNANTSELKLHYAGQLRTGALIDRGTYGFYWSKTQASVTTGSYLEFSKATAISRVLSYSKSERAWSLRCLRDAVIIAPPSVSNVTMIKMTDSLAIGRATVTPDGGAPVTERGLCWSNSGNPSIADHVVVDSGKGIGDFTASVEGLEDGRTYFIRAYATNSAGTAYSSTATSFKICRPFTAIHIAGQNGAPENKTIKYSSISTSMSGALRCWTTQNIGAEREALSVSDTTQASAGWYWQFNRGQGYKPSGTSYAPYYAWVGWIQSANESSDWTAAADPCRMLLAGGWRMPTSAEWANVDGAPQNWAKAGDAYNSVLKLHAAGYMLGGSLAARGTSGNYWSTTQGYYYSSGDRYNGSYLTFNSTGSVMSSLNKWEGYALNIRCLRDTLVMEKPTVTSVIFPTKDMTVNSAMGSATVTLDGGAAVTERGFCWSTTSIVPTKLDSVMVLGKGTGDFSGIMKNLQEGPTYYVRAYAINSKGISYSPAATSFKICNPVTVIHRKDQNGSPEDKTITYSTVSTGISGAARCWITQNLGAEQEATSVTDTTQASAGWYWQFNRLQGYKPNGTSYTPYYAWVNWVQSANENAGWAAAADPCRMQLGAGWRMPLQTEWAAVDAAPQYWSTYNAAYNSVLKLHAGGYILAGALKARGTSGDYWSSTQGYYYSSGDRYTGYFLSITATTSDPASTAYKPDGYAFSVRCLRDIITIEKPTVTNVTFPTTDMSINSARGSATVTLDGGATVTERGVCWSTTSTTPATSDNIIKSGDGTGGFATLMEDLKEGPTYYARAYAINSAGTAYSPAVTSFKICNPFTVIHQKGLNGAPENKTITYHTISTGISGAARCWITQNLGADSEATSVSDTAQASAGWYWQFNRSQGYKPNGTSYIPYYEWVGWIQSANESSDWAVTADPCRLLLGGGWRMPTGAELSNADAVPQNWGKAADAYNSVLKLHTAGYMLGGSLAARGTSGNYWSTTQGYYYSSGDRYNGSYLTFNNAGSVMSSLNKWEGYALNVRCLRDIVALEKPTVTNVTFPTKDMTINTARGYANVSLDGGVAITERGFCWSITSTIPTVADNKFELGSGTGDFTGVLTSLVEGPTYYVRAYAINSEGISYSPAVTSFKICNPFTVIHRKDQNGVPEDKIITYHTISTGISGAARCWITQNLGAEQEATSVTDTTQASAGWYWQFNRLQGYKPNGTSYTPYYAWVNWVQSANENAGWAAAADPCRMQLGAGWRMPLQTEWAAVDAAPQYWSTYNAAYNSVLKLHAGGYMLAGALKARGTSGDYWSSTQGYYYSSGDRYTGYFLSITATTSDPAATAYKPDGYAFSVRCLRDVIAIEKPTVTNAAFPTDDMTINSARGTATVTLDGGATVTERGLCWSNSATVLPSISDNVVKAGNGTGSFAALLESLKEGPTYYVRAYATNSAGTTYSPAVTSFKICNPFTVIHQKGLNGAPENKTVTYHTISTGISGAARCWITQNLGADREATSVSDTAQASAGWYWQFNRSQGYRPNGTSYIPYYAWVAWIQSSNESSDWAAAADPCRLLLGGGWRMPTLAELASADDVPQNWGKAADAYNSVLKLHTAGYMYAGALAARGTTGYYWSTTQGYYYSSGDRYNGGYLSFNATTSGTSYANKWEGYAFNTRCLRDTVSIEKPTVTNVVVPTSDMTVNSATGYANVSLSGGATVTDRGLCWSTTSAVPTINDTKRSVDSGTGDFNGLLDELKEGPTYYVRAYAINSKGISYSPAVTSFKICNPFTIIHRKDQNGAPENKVITYKTISTGVSGAARCWITQNLGAEKEAASVTDTTQASAGWYWQFNRAQGYKPNGASYIPYYGWVAWIQSANESSDWAVASDPCRILIGAGWRMPTRTEWTAVDAAPQYWNTYTDAYNSVLKLHAAGYMLTGALKNRGTTGSYWSNTQGNYYSSGDRYTGYYLSITSATSDPAAFANKWEGHGFSVRCLRDAIVPEKPSVTNVDVPTSDMGTSTAKANATVTLDGGAAVTERGLCWSTATLTPSITDNVIKVGTGTGDFSTVMAGLDEGPTYYVRAYAVNDAGIAYSPKVTSFKICNEFTIIHREGLNGVPESKTVTYHTISSGVSGAARCWITQNLGADREASSASDAAPESAGWYWQFNRSQGYKPNGPSYIPYYAWVNWIQSANESSDWAVAADPCRLLLAAGWRMPTASEWATVNAQPQYWSKAADAYNSVLKLHAAGYMYGGALAARGTTGDYWSTTQSSYYSSGDRYTGGYLTFNAATSGVLYANKWEGSAFNIRCLRDVIITEKPSVTNVSFPTAEMTTNTATGYATVTIDARSPVTDRGFCWSKTTAVPTISDNMVSLGSGTGDFTGTLSGLTDGQTYYVRGYAINSAGISYSPVVTSFKVCNPFTVVHSAGINGAPVNKTITYNTITTVMSGAAKCWLTQNLGADRPASSATDNAEEASGWYWQFNRSQGYKHDGAARTPATGVYSINENSEWNAANDPCRLLLANNWRLPTNAEWTNADAQPQYWGNYTNTYASVLKLGAAGYLLNATLTGRGTTGAYWSSNQGYYYSSGDRYTGYYLSVTGTASVTTWVNKWEGYGFNIRCIKD